MMNLTMEPLDSPGAPSRPAASRKGGVTDTATATAQQQQPKPAGARKSLGVSNSRLSLGGSLLDTSIQGGGNAATPSTPGKNRRYSLKFGANLPSPDSPEGKNKIAAIMVGYQHEIQLVVENKVTTKNTWSLELIENLEGILGGLGGSFHGASLTVQAATEVYAQRVDGTHADTFRMLEMVLNSTKRGEADGEEARKARKKGDGEVHAAQTLESNLTNITSSKVDRDFDIDPNMKRLMASHEEVGAKAMLLTILGTDRGCQVVFDTSNVPAFPVAETPASSTTGSDENNDTTNNNNSTLVGGPLLQSFLRNMDFKSTCIVPSLTLGLREELAKVSGKAMEAPKPLPAIVIAEPEEPEYANNNDDWYDDGGDDYDGGGGGDDDDHMPLSSIPVAATNMYMESKMLEQTGGAFSTTSYFDPKYLQNTTSSSSSAMNRGWAGPSHWKFTMPKATSNNAPKTSTNSSSTRAKKQNVTIDFFAPKPDAKLFAPPPRSASSTLLTKKDQGKSHLLPLDVHFESIDLQRLFGRPNTILSRGNAVVGMAVEEAAGTNQSTSGTGEVNVMVEFKDMDNPHEMIVGDDFTPHRDGDDDDDDDGDFYDCEDDDGASPATFANLNLVAPAHHVERIRVAFATRAKKVDVKKLKTDLWNAIEEEVPKHGVGEEALHLTESIHTLKQVESQTVTVPFYFICLLHLANEMGLCLEGSGELDDVTICTSSGGSSSGSR